MRDPSTPRVFLSYSRKDGLDFARRLQAMLEAEGLSLYRDLSDLEGGEDWWRQVETAIKSVEHVVLVLTPGSLQSRYVRDEWKLARQEGKSVWPVSSAGELDLSHLPRRMARAHRHDIDIEESFDRLVLGLRGPARERRTPFMADPLLTSFVERPEKFAEIKQKLLDAQSEPVAITAALRGAGGYGKTALANALCHDPEIEDAFSDGILRVTLGEKPEDLVSRMADLIVVLTGERPDVIHLEAAKTKLAEALDDRRCLLVIDDAWRPQDLAPFLHRGPKDRTTRLVTTRDDRVLPAETARVAVDAMTSDQALEMLAGGLGNGAVPLFQNRLAALAIRLGEWPLLLSLANSLLRARIRRGTSLADALGYAERALEKRGLAGAFPSDNHDAWRATAWGTLAVSLEQLREDEHLRFAELAVFVEDAEIPTTAALGLWQQTAGLDEFDGEDLLRRLSDLSLLIDLDLGRGLFRLHDVFRSLLRSEVVKDKLPELDRKLMVHFRSTCPDGDLARLIDRYGLRHAIAHLRDAGEEEAAKRLLLDPAWMQAKLEALGVQLLLADYAAETPQSATFAVGAVLTLTANALGKRPGQLPAQLLARLLPKDAEGLGTCLRNARARISLPALVPLHPSFTPPGAELRRFEGHEEFITSVALLPDGRRVLSGSDDWTLRLWDLETGAELRRFEGHKRRVTSVALLPDGRRALSGSDDWTLRLWDLETGAELRRFEGHEGFLTSVSLLLDGRRVLSGSYDSTLRLWDLETGAELRRFEGHKDWVNSVVLLPDGRRALSGSDDWTLRLWDLETGAELRRFEGHEGRVTSVALLPDGRRALSGSAYWTLGLWDLETGAALSFWGGHEGFITSVVLLPDGRRVLSGSSDSTLRLWDLETGAELRRFEGHKRAVTGVAPLPDGRRALSGSDDSTLRLWDLETGAELRRLEGHEGLITSVAPLPDGRRVLSGSDDRTLRLWNLETAAALRRFEGHSSEVTSVSLLPDGRRVLSGSDDRTLRLWDLETGAELRRFEGHSSEVTSVALLPDGRRVLSGSDDWTLRLWDLETGAELRRFEGHEGFLTSVSLLLDGRRVLSGSYDSTLRLWDLETGAELRRFEGHKDWVTSVVLLPDGRRALSGSDDWTLLLWDLETGAELGRFEGHWGSVTSVVLLPDGRRALTGSEDRTLSLWDLETGSELRRFEGHKRRVTSVALLPDGRRALSASSDSTLRLWDLETGAELRRFEGHEERVTSVVLLPDGRRALSGSEDWTLRLWDLETGAELACLTFDAALSALAWSERMAAAVVGDGHGLVHVIELLDRPTAAAPASRNTGR